MIFKWYKEDFGYDKNEVALLSDCLELKGIKKVYIRDRGGLRLNDNFKPPVKFIPSIFCREMAYSSQAFRLWSLTAIKVQKIYGIYNVRGVGKRR